MEHKKQYHLIEDETVVESFDTIPELVEYLRTYYTPDEEDHDDVQLWIAETVKLVDLQIKREVKLHDNGK